MEEKMYIVLQETNFSSDTQVRNILSDWLVLNRIIQEPTVLFIDKERKTLFSIDFIKELIEMSTKDDDLEWCLISDKYESQMVIQDGSITETILITDEVYHIFQSIIEDYIDQKMIAFGVYAYVRPFEEYLFHNVPIIEKRKCEHEDIKSLPKIYNQNQQMEIDCSRLSGYDFFYEGLCFTSCWKMWISSSYFHFIPKAAYLDIQQVYEVNELPNEVIRTSLYIFPKLWNQEKNKHFQELYRAQLGFDNLDWNNGIGPLKEPYAEFTRLKDGLQMIQYQNEHLQPTTKRQAKHFTTRYYNKANEKYYERRIFGSLHFTAFFPWQNNQEKTMMNYWVIDPNKTVDEGLEVYTFYIQQLLNIPIYDEQYGKMQPILRFYIPKDCLSNVPFEKIRQNLPHHFFHMSTKKNYAFDIRHNKNKLRVEFLEVENLIKEEVNLRTNSNNLNKE